MKGWTLGVPSLSYKPVHCSMNTEWLGGAQVVCCKQILMESYMLANKFRFEFDSGAANNGPLIFT